MESPQYPSVPVCGSRAFARLAACLGAGVAILALTGCDGTEPTAAAPSGRPFSATLQGRTIHLVLDDCEVFLPGADGKRERVVTTDFYPMFSSCHREEISADGQYITVSLGRMAFGAGGCCATHGVWRTRDGVYWERRERGRWLSPGQVEALRQKEREEQERLNREERRKASSDSE